MSTPAPPARPTVEQVANLLRARTKDSSGNEVGTFDDDTRPTADQVEEHIDAAVALVGARLPAIENLSVELQAAVSELVAYRAALRVEKSYFPEQVRSDRSAYDQLRQEYLDDLQAVLDTIDEGGGSGEFPGVYPEFGSLPVGSWTSINRCYPDPDPDLVAP